MVERSLGQGSSNEGKGPKEWDFLKGKKEHQLLYLCIKGAKVLTVTGQVQGKVRVSQKPDHMGPFRLCLGAWT